MPIFTPQAPAAHRSIEAYTPLAYASAELCVAKGFSSRRYLIKFDRRLSAYGALVEPGAIEESYKTKSSHFVSPCAAMLRGGHGPRYSLVLMPMHTSMTQIIQ